MAVQTLTNGFDIKKYQRQALEQRIAARANGQEQPLKNRIEVLKRTLDQNPDNKVLIQDYEKQLQKIQRAKKLLEMSDAGINQRLAKYRAALERQGLPADKIEEQVKRQKEQMLAERTAYRKKLQGQTGVTEPARKAKEASKKKGFFAGIKEFFGKHPKLAKAGKIGGLALGVAGLGYGLYKLFKSDDAQPVQGVTGEVPAEDQHLDAVAQTPETVTEETNPPANPQAANDNVFQLNELGQYKVNEGDILLTIAKLNLIHKGNANPEPGEVIKEADRLVELNPDIKWEPGHGQDKYYAKIFPGQLVETRERLNRAA